jgi:hypothetical protein
MAGNTRPASEAPVVARFEGRLEELTMVATGAAEAEADAEGEGEGVGEGLAATSHCA